MNKRYGANRVLDPKFVLPISAWRLDNSRILRAGEMKVAVKRIHLESTSFKQICLEANSNEEKIKQRIMDIIIRRGKLHNPVTDTGGLIYGTVAEINPEYDNIKDLAIGEEVLCNVSTTGIPLYISKILSVDKAYGQIDVEGYAIMFSNVPIVRRPVGLPINLLLFIFNESGTLYRLSSSVSRNKSFLVLGNNMLMCIVYGYAIRRIAGKDARIVCLLDKKTDNVLRGDSVNKLIGDVFNQMRSMDILKPLECLNALNADGAYDISVNCANIPGAETISILATKNGGSVIFANLINNYNIALYITESVSRQINIKCADGYYEEYDEFDMELVRELAPYLEHTSISNVDTDDDPTHPTTRTEHLLEVSGNRQSRMEDFVCESRTMAAVLNEILQVARFDCNVFITGNTGVGKSKVAEMIQKNSSRIMQPFIKVNCASISPDSIESEFLGFETATSEGRRRVTKKGVVELAENGALFLEEVDGLPMDMQVKLLRILQDGEYFRVNGNKPIRTNVRIISASGTDIEEKIEKGIFRRDLYYHLNVVPIRIPSLEYRSADVPALVRHFLKTYGKKFSISRGIDDDAVEYLQGCEWPGNITELENVVQRLMISSKAHNITLTDVMRQIHGDIFEVSSDSSLEKMAGAGQMDMAKMVDSFEKSIIKMACEKHGSTRKAAAAIGISQTQLVRKKKKYQLP